MLSSSIAILGLFSAVQAGVQLDLTSAAQEMLPELSIDSTCPLQAPFGYISSIRHQHSETCSHSHHHSPQNTTSSPTVSLSDSESNPWSIYPACTTLTSESDLKFCVFTSTTIYNNRGISILTKPSIARLMSKFPAFTSPPLFDPAANPNDERDIPFEVKPIPVKGLGMIATRTIEKGDLIKAHPAIGIFHNDAVDRSSENYATHLAPLVHLSVEQLPSPSREKFMAMAAHNESEEPVIEKIYTNTFGEDFGGEEHSIVIPETARLNHDCRPNAMYYFDPKTFTHYTHASRRILAGEEITITYIDPLQTRLRRRKAIKRSWGFDCSCSLCSQSPQFVRESNRRIVQINALIKVFSRTNSKTKMIRGTVNEAELLVSLYEQERLHAGVTEAYRLAALSYSAVGNEWMAVKWAMKAVETGLINDGPIDGNVRDMERLLEKPKAHWSWGLNVKGKSCGCSRNES